MMFCNDLCLLQREFSMIKGLPLSVGIRTKSVDKDYAILAKWWLNVFLQDQ